MWKSFPLCTSNPRKSASQQRSRLTVDALLEATARVLMKEGYDRTSTNKIAAVAGVSIGSLYQYFPSKEALVAAVIDRHAAEHGKTASLLDLMTDFRNHWEHRRELEMLSPQIV